MAESVNPNAYPQPHGLVGTPHGGSVSPAKAKAKVVATRTGSTVPAPHPAVFQPWTALLGKADARYKTEITAALNELEAATAQAGQVLDTANILAAGAAAQLEAAAWAAWSKYMALADDTRNAILDPAVKQYDVAIGYAHNQYVKALADAAKTYQTILTDANSAKSDAAKIVA